MCRSVPKELLCVDLREARYGSVALVAVILDNHYIALCLPEFLTLVVDGVVGRNGRLFQGQRVVGKCCHDDAASELLIGVCREAISLH